MNTSNDLSSSPTTVAETSISCRVGFFVFLHQIALILLLESKSTMASNPTGSRRSPGYTKKEDLLNCKAFIIASEDPIVGTSQKGKDFKEKHHREYVRLLSEQERIDQLQYNQGSETFREMAGPPVVFNKRLPDSVYNRFKDHISHRVLKFIGVEETTERESGTDDEQYFDLCNTVYKKRYPSLGSFTDLRVCKEYLNGMPKFVTFKVLMENQSEERKTKRPIGTKKAKQAEDDVALIKKVIDESSVVSKGSASTNTTEQFQQGVFSMLAKMGDSMISHWKEENDSVD